MIILGLTTAIHDSSVAIVKDGKIIAASEEERFNREKHSGKFPINAIRFCLEKASIDINKINEVVVGMKWLERAKARFELRASKKFPELTKKAAKQAQADINRSKEVGIIFKEKFGYKSKITFLDHYDCHASACYFPSSFNRAAILILDGAGEKASARIYSAQGTKLKTLLQIDYPNSAGRFYGWITDYLGFKIDSDEGKVMGLAPYGDSSLVKKMRKVLKVKSDGTYDLDLSYFGFVQDNEKGVSDKFIKIFGPPRKKDEKITDRHKNIAKAAQVVLEEAAFSMANLAKKITKEKNLCLGGGVALNSVANGKIAASGLFKDIYIYPDSGDGGTSVGAAFYSYYSKQKKKVFYKENQSPFVGYGAKESEILDALRRHKLKYIKPENIYKETAKYISENKIVGWFSGRTEIGPRALGNRSILADPRDIKNKDRVNKKIKFRESFRPFAPTVLEEFADEYFEMHGLKSPYMILAFQVKKDKRGIIPAVTHIDNSARLQTVSREQNKSYRNLINEFYKITKVPVVLNTSFNRAGEPIVNTPEDAVQSFLGSDLDVLVLEDFLIIK